MWVSFIGLFTHLAQIHGPYHPVSLRT